MSSHYDELVSRNIGLLTPAQQARLGGSCAVVCGVGGLGGPIAELLTRIGVGRIILIDHGTFEPTNLNRQNFCFGSTNGERKTDVTRRFLLDINPGLRVETHLELTSANCEAIVSAADVAFLAVDDLHPILLLSRACRKAGVPLVEGWAVAYGNARVFTKDTPSLEEAYRFPTSGREVDDIGEAERRGLLLQSIQSLSGIEGMADFYPPAARQRLIERGEGTTLGPLVWLTCCLMAMEGVKALLGLEPLALAPRFALYDPFRHRIPGQEGMVAQER